MQHNIQTVLASLRGVAFIGLDQETIVPLKGGKGNPMKGRVTKRTIGSTVLICQNKNTNTYENMVRNKIVGELLADATLKAETGVASLVDILDAAAIAELETKVAKALEDGDDARREESEERFQVSARKWGQRVPNSPFIEHTPKGELNARYYLDTIFLRAGKSEFFLDGKPIDEKDIEGYEKPAAREGDHIQGGLKAENQVQVRSIGLDSILAIRTGGANYAGQFIY